MEQAQKIYHNSISVPSQFSDWFPKVGSYRVPVLFSSCLFDSVLFSLPKPGLFKPEKAKSNTMTSQHAVTNESMTYQLLQ